MLVEEESGAKTAAEGRKELDLIYLDLNKGLKTRCKWINPVAADL